jgi:hypothetical protein
MNLDDVSPKTVRLWAWVDSSVTWTLAIPPMAKVFISTLYRINGWIGGESVAPAFLPVQLFFVSLSGVLISLWVLARLLHPVPVFALLDGWGRVAVSALLIYFVLVAGAPRVLLLFVVTEMAGAIGQLRVVYRRH